MCIINCICNSLCMLSWLSMRLTEMNAIYSCHAETTISIYLNVLLSNSPWGRKLSPKYLGLFCKMLQFSMKNSTPQRNSYSSSVSDSHFFNKYHFWELCFRYLRALKKRKKNLVLCWSFQACGFRRVIVCVIYVCNCSVKVPCLHMWDLVELFHALYRFSSLSLSYNYHCFCDPQEDVGVVRQVDPTTKEVTYNPRYEEMFSPEVQKCSIDCHFSHAHEIIYTHWLTWAP